METLYKLRFIFFLITQLLILFGSLLVPSDVYENILLPILFLVNIGAGILLISKSKLLMWFIIILFGTSAIAFGANLISRNQSDEYILLRLSIYFIFHIIITYNIVKQVCTALIVDKNVIIGLMSGYISLGFLAFFLFMCIELVFPGAFQGVLLEGGSFELRMDNIMYFAYITLLTIGYGEILPVITIAQKATILVGLVGQFYMVIVTAVVIEKYIKHSIKNV